MEDEGGDQGFLYLCFLNGMVAIDMKKLVSGGRLESETSSPPDLSPLPVAVDKRIVFRHQQLPSGFGFCVDGSSNLYVVGGQWVETDRRGFLKVIKSKEDDGISRTMFVADLSARTVKFSKRHVFEAGKTFTVVTKFDEKIYAWPPTSFVSFLGESLRSQLLRCMTLLHHLQNRDPDRNRNQSRGSRLLHSMILTSIHVA